MHRPAPRAHAPRCARLKPANLGRSAPGLRVILERCLDPDPAAAIGADWRWPRTSTAGATDRPLICTPEPSWRQTVPRLLRRQRRAIFTAALSLILIAATTAIALVKSQRTLRALGLHKIGRLWDDPEGRAYRFQKTSAPHLLQADDFHVKIAAPRLEEYDLLGPDDWRRRDDVRTLPKADREDLRGLADGAGLRALPGPGRPAVFAQGLVAGSQGPGPCQWAAPNPGFRGATAIV